MSHTPSPQRRRPPNPSPVRSPAPTSVPTSAPTSAPNPAAPRLRPRPSITAVYQALHRRGVLLTLVRPGARFCRRGRRLLHPSYRRAKPGGAGG